MYNNTEAKNKKQLRYYSRGALDHFADAASCGVHSHWQLGHVSLWVYGISRVSVV